MSSLRGEVAEAHHLQRSDIHGREKGMTDWYKEYGIKVHTSMSAWEEFATEKGTVRIEPIEIAFALSLEDAARVTPEILQAIEMWVCVITLKPDLVFDVPFVWFYGRIFYVTIEELERFKPELFAPYLKGIENIVMVDRCSWELNFIIEFDTRKQWQSFYRRIGFGIVKPLQDVA